MDNNEKLRQEIIEKISANLRQAASIKLADILEYFEGKYQPSEKFTLPLALTDKKIAYKYLVLIMLYVKEISPAIDFSSDGANLVINEDYVRSYSLEIKDNELENMKNNLNEVGKLINSPGGMEFFINLIFSCKKRPDFDHKDLYGKIILQIIAGSTNKEKTGICVNN